MTSGGEHVGVSNDVGGAIFYACSKTVFDSGRGKFHVGDFYVSMGGFFFEERGDLREHVIGGFVGGAVVNEKDGVH